MKIPKVCFWCDGPIFQSFCIACGARAAQVQRHQPGSMEDETDPAH